MSILTAVFQAIGQALTFIFPISESGHSAIFHDFAGRYSAACSELTGLVHIGIALGIIVAFYKVFLRLILEFVSTWTDIFQKKFNLREAKNSRKFMLLTFIPYVFMLAYLIPAGSKGNIYQLLHSYSYDGNLLSEGACFLVTGAVMFVASYVLGKDEKGKQLNVVNALLISLCLFFAIPISGLSACAAILFVGIILKVNKKIAFRYFVSISAPVLIVTGIIQIATCVTYVPIIEGVIAVVLSGVVAFFASRFLLSFVKDNKAVYFSYYDFAIGFITLVIGIVQIIAK